MKSKTDLWCRKIYHNDKAGVINDPLSQTHTHPPVVIVAIFTWKLFCFLRDFEKWGRTDGRTTLVKIAITTDRDCGLASWITIKNITKLLRWEVKFQTNYFGYVCNYERCQVLLRKMYKNVERLCTYVALDSSSFLEKIMCYSLK